MVVGARASAFVHLHQEEGAGEAGAGAAAAPSYLMLVPRMVAALLVRLQESLGSVDTLDQTDAEVGLRTLGSQVAVFEARCWHTLAIAVRKPAVRIAAAAAAGLGSRCILGTVEPGDNPGTAEAGRCCSCTLRSSPPTEQPDD